jgi:hypothetical protein
LQNWPTVALIGNKFVIPRVCPNCMAPAECPQATTYLKARLGGSTNYTMTFFYCDACDRALKAMRAIEKKQLSYGPQLLALWVLMSFVFFIGMAVVMSSEASGVWTLLVLAAVVALGTYYTRRMAARRRALWDEGKPPLPPNAVGYGFAACLIESKGFRQKTATFSAARQPWLDLLLDANIDRGDP